MAPYKGVSPHAEDKIGKKANTKKKKKVYIDVTESAPKQDPPACSFAKCT